MKKTNCETISNAKHFGGWSTARTSGGKRFAVDKVNIINCKLRGIC